LTRSSDREVDLHISRDEFFLSTLKDLDARGSGKNAKKIKNTNKSMANPKVRMKRVKK